MDHNWLTLIWLAAGVLLALAELALPGLVVVFLGVAALVVSGMCAIGWIREVAVSIGVWMVTSVVLVLLLRKLVLKWFPPEVRIDPQDEDLDAYGQIVPVLEECHEDQSDGRIRFAGTTWPAVSVGGVIPAGSRARLLYRDNLAWFVEPVESKDAQHQLEARLEKDIIG